MDTFIGDIAEEVPVINSLTMNNEVDRIFHQNSRIEGIVVVDEGKPVGLIMRSQFYQKIGTKYGFNVYMGRSVTLIMSTFFLKVEGSNRIADVCIDAMNRPQEHLYDYVIITRNDQYAGICSIRNLLMTFAEVQAHTARDSNPLTGLPGNRRIDAILTMSLNLPAYTIIYIDLDRFKEYNDTYGFNKGDQLIQETAQLLQTCIDNTGNIEGFLGHIGGDDFIICFPGHDYETLCQEIIQQFDECIQHFFIKEDVANGFFDSFNRYGQPTRVPLTSLSLAVITNEKKSFDTIEALSLEASLIKKKCKALNGSCLICNG